MYLKFPNKNQIQPFSLINTTIHKFPDLIFFRFTLRREQKHNKKQKDIHNPGPHNTSKSNEIRILQISHIITDL